MPQKQKILEKATKVFLKLGIRSVTMDDLAQELGISKKTLYKHFDNKTTLLRASISQFQDNEFCKSDMMEAIEKDAIESMFMTYEKLIGNLQLISPSAIIEIKKFHPDIWEDVMIKQRTIAYRNLTFNLQKGIEEGHYRKDLNLDLILKFYYNQVSLFTDDELYPSHLVSKQVLFREYLVFFLNGIATSDGKTLIDKYKQKYFNQSTHQ